MLLKLVTEELSRKDPSRKGVRWTVIAENFAHKTAAQCGMLTICALASSHKNIFPFFSILQLNIGTVCSIRNCVRAPGRLTKNTCYGGSLGSLDRVGIVLQGKFLTAATLRAAINFARIIWLIGYTCYIACRVFVVADAFQPWSEEERTRLGACLKRFTDRVDWLTVCTETDRRSQLRCMQEALRIGVSEKTLSVSFFFARFADTFGFAALFK